ncbi:MAG TPA: DUF5825 family protein [Pseudonocardiaceae bacterium]|nr:DUF5825 family protein [Pseudonocardiaceae bacterium]
MTTTSATTLGSGRGLGREIDASELHPDVAIRAAEDGCERLVVTGPVVTGQDIDADLGLLRFLREATSKTLRVAWQLAGRPLVAERDLVHLVPPTAGVDSAAAECVTAWRGGYRYGSYHYRWGPDFVTVKDIRPGGPPVHLTIDGDSAQQFRELTDVADLADLSPAATTALADAVEFGLAVRGERTFLVLPWRMRRWPVPYVAA